MSRRIPTDEQWEQIEGHLSGRVRTRERSWIDNRLFVDAILWMVGTRHAGVICQRYLASGAVNARFCRWSHAGVWERLFHVFADTPDFEYFLIDRTISKAHADATGRAIAPPIYWRLYKGRQIECSFNKLKRFRRVTLGCEKTLSASMGFVHLACAVIWLR